MAGQKEAPPALVGRNMKAALACLILEIPDADTAVVTTLFPRRLDGWVLWASGSMFIPAVVGKRAERKSVSECVMFQQNSIYSNRQ